ncbi:MAG TPA: DUF4232 domain-containing protein [Candidatus Binatia bacterium]|nr:DUF4232 domain-containing protein [Candidatus Binatia bacterium]
MLIRIHTPALMLVAAAAFIAQASGCESTGPSSTPTPAATSTATTATTTTPAPTASASSTPSGRASATPTAATALACTGDQLNAVIGAESSASGGQQGMTLLLANHGNTACKLSGSLKVKLLGASGQALPTLLQTPTPGGQAWLVPQRVALDPAWPQPGEVTVQVSWRTGDVAPGQCSGSAPQVGEIGLQVPSGGTVAAAFFANGTPTMAPCKGVIQVGAITQFIPGQALGSILDATFSAVSTEFGMDVTQSCTPTPQKNCLTTEAGPAVSSTGVGAYQSFQYASTGGGAVCTAYVYMDQSGWRPLNVICTQNVGFNPLLNQPISIFGPGSGCAQLHSSPSHGSPVTGCLTWSQDGSGTYSVDQGPTFTPETDPTSHWPEGTMWWHLQGKGWVTQDFLVAGTEG